MHKKKIDELKEAIELLKGQLPSLAEQLSRVVFEQEHPEVVKQKPTEDVKEALTGLVKMFGKRIVLVGGHAVRHWGAHMRPTSDIDLVFEVPELDEVRKQFNVIRETPITVVTTFKGIELDFLKHHKPWFSAMLAASPIESFDGIPIKIALPEWIILSKLDRLTEKDEADIKGCLKLPGVYEKARRLLRRYAPMWQEDLDSWKNMADLGF